jgi:hypothetical protein
MKKSIIIFLISSLSVILNCQATLDNCSLFCTANTETTTGYPTQVEDNCQEDFFAGYNSFSSYFPFIFQVPGKFHPGIVSGILPFIWQPPE